MTKYDLIVIGTGGAGYQVAIRCREAGWKVAAIDREPFGGTCSVRGCIPKKVLSGTAHIADMTRRLNEVDVLSPSIINWRKLIAFKRSFTEPVPPDTVEGLEKAGVEVYSGSPAFVNDTTLELDGEQLQAEHIHIATGLEPAKLPIEGFEHLIDSDAFLDLPELPQRIIFVGAGYISFEFAHVAAICGAKVTILHADDHPLAQFDADIVAALCDASRELGIEVVLNAAAKTITKEGEKYVVTAANDEKYVADLVVHGAGRVPSISNMDLEAANIDYDKRRGIIVDNFMRSPSNPRITAAGDVANAGPQLSPVSKRQGAIAANTLLEDPQPQPDYFSTPSVVFTSPPVAKVGYLEHEAHEKGLDFEVTTKDLSDWFDSKRLNQPFTMSKILVERHTGKILGAHLMGDSAAELINIFSLAIETGLTIEQLKAPIFAFPTASDDLRAMLP